MTPDREVQEAIRGVFGHFERFGTLRQVLLWYHQENITLPHLHVSEGEGGRELCGACPPISNFYGCSRIRLMRVRLLMDGPNADRSLSRGVPEKVEGTKLRWTIGSSY